MKRNLLLIFISVFCTQFSFGQLSEDFENGAPDGWVIDAKWKIQNSSTFSSESFIPSEHTNFIGYNDDTAGSSAPLTISFTTPFIDISSVENPVLQFDFYYYNANYEEAGQEVFKVYYSADGENFELLAHIEEGSGNWQPFFIKLDKEKGTNIQLKFEYDDGGNWNFGLAIDDITVKEQSDYSGNFIFVEENPVKIVSFETETKSFESAFNYTGKIEGVNGTVTYEVDGVSKEVEIENLTYGENSFIVSGFPLGEYDLSFSIDIEGNVFTAANTQFFVVSIPVLPFDLEDVHGNSFSLYNTLKSGKAVIIDFFASWCGPCEISTPLLNTIWEDNGSGTKNLEVIGVSIESTDSDSKVANLGWGADYPKFGYNIQSEEMWTIYNDQFGESSIPFFVFICPNVEDPRFSEVTYSSVGWPTNAKADFGEALTSCESANFGVGTDNLVELENLLVYPNPADSKINISFISERNAEVKVIMNNNLGQEVLHSTHRGSKIVLDVANIAAGLYTVRIETANGFSSRKILIEK